MRARFVLTEIGVGLWRNLSITISVVIVTAVSLFFLGSGLLFQRQVDQLRTVVYDEVQVSIFLCGAESTVPSCADGEVTQQQRDEIAAELRDPLIGQYIDSVEYESKQEAYERFLEQFEGSPITENVTAEQLPESFRVRLSDPEQSGTVAAFFEGRAGVESVDDQSDLFEQIFRFLNGATFAAWVLAGAMLIAALLLVATTIRLAAFNRRREIGIMRLVGASKAFIQLPFMLEGIIAATVGALLSSGLLVAFARFFVEGYVGERIQLGGLVGTADAMLIVPWLLLTGVLFAGVSSLITLERYLRV
ncbi:permease-like cell division protein FtsX [Aquipuribacter nitratireducens]|uniref:Cell division protein FtsX n=1 Tax=Aquipuribacter nitratireducens TaxID=650104 RepID=A0ABW0GWF4_9MICO